MIFATCGSSPAPFRRMMEALAELPAERLYVQHGPVTPPPCAGAYDYLPFNRMIEFIQRADIVVSHAGVGSIMCALRAGHTPIVLPRLKRYEETVDDHQAELAEALADRGSVVVAWTPEELVAAVTSAGPGGAARALAADALGEAVRAAIHGEQHPTFVRNNRVPHRTHWAWRKQSARRPPICEPTGGAHEAESATRANAISLASASRSVVKRP